MEPNEFVGWLETDAQMAKIADIVDRAYFRNPGDMRFIDSGELAGAQRKINEMHQAYIRSGMIAQCMHFPLLQTKGIYWAVFLPGYACEQCYASYCNMIAGSPEDYRCDICKTVVDVDDLRNGIWTIPAIPQADGGLLPPLTISFGACITCVKKEQIPAGLRRRT